MGLKELLSLLLEERGDRCRPVFSLREYFASSVKPSHHGEEFHRYLGQSFYFGI
jgi:hypothetical protein